MAPRRRRTFPPTSGLKADSLTAARYPPANSISGEVHDECHRACNCRGGVGNAGRFDRGDCGCGVRGRPAKEGRAQIVQLIVMVYSLKKTATSEGEARPKGVYYHMLVSTYQLMVSHLRL